MPGFKNDFENLNLDTRIINILVYSLNILPNIVERFSRKIYNRITAVSDFK